MAFITHTIIKTRLFLTIAAAFLIVFGLSNETYAGNGNYKDGNYEIVVTPNSQGVKAGESISFKIDVLSIVGFADPVTLSATLAPLNSGVTLNLSSATVMPGDSATLTVNTINTAAPGTFTVEIRGSSGSIEKTAIAVFDLWRGPTYVIDSMTPSKTAVGQMPEKIVLRGTGLPASGTVFFDSIPVTPKKMTAAKTVVKAYPSDLFSVDRTINVKVVDANGQFSNTLQFIVGTGITPSVSLSVLPSIQEVMPSQIVSYNVNIDRQNFSRNVTLSVSGFPEGTMGSFSPAKTKGNSSTLTIGTIRTAPLGSYPLTINGAANGVNINPITVMLVIKPFRSARLFAAPTQTTIDPGQSAVYSLTIFRIDFTETVDLSVNGLPMNATASFNPQSTDGDSSTLTVTTSSTTPAGTYTLTIEGRGSGITVIPVTAALIVNSAPVQPAVGLSVSSSADKIEDMKSRDPGRNFVVLAAFAVRNIAEEGVLKCLPQDYTHH